MEHKQTPLANLVSETNHNFQAKLWEAMEASGEVRSAAARWCRDNEVSVTEAKATLNRMEIADKALVEAAQRQALAHASMQNLYEEKMDSAFDCPKKAAKKTENIVSIDQAA